MSAAEGQSDLVRAQLEQLRARAEAQRLYTAEQHTGAVKSVKGGTFVFRESSTPAAVWGDGEQVLWAEGEPFYMVADPGGRKTTLASQLVLRAIGIHEPELLGFTVKPIAGKVLYVAADRPRQQARSLRRMVSTRNKALLDRRLVVHPGPLPFDLASAHPETLAEFAEARGAKIVVLDSLKDVAPRLSDEEVGSCANAAIQHLIARGIDVLGLHHFRKSQPGGSRTQGLDDVYGSRWITAGAGSVIALDGKPDDPIVRIRHLKTPSAFVGPITMTVDGKTGSCEPTDIMLVDSAGEAEMMGAVATLVKLRRDKVNYPPTAREFRAALTGNTGDRGKAIRLAIEEGYVVTTPDGKTKRHKITAEGVKALTEYTKRAGT